VLLVKLLSVGNPNENGVRTLFFKVNGQNRSVDITDSKLKVEVKKNQKADLDNENEIGAPLPGKLTKLLVEVGQEVKKNQNLFIVEAMKMENIVGAPENGVVKKIVLNENDMVAQDDLVIIVE